MYTDGFDRWAETYDQDMEQISEDFPFAGYDEVLKTIAGIVCPARGQRVLDLGVGTGRLSQPLYQEGVEIVALDASGEMLKKAREKMPEATLIQWDLAQGLPDELRQERFHGIVSSYALHHLKPGDTVQLLRELTALLLPGGSMAIGDIAFLSQDHGDRVRREVGEDWDDEEYYLIAEFFQRELRDLPVEYRQISFCAGIIIVHKS